MSDEINIDELLEKWYETKAEIVLLEKKCEKFKKCSEKIMDKLNKDKLTASKFVLKRVEMTRNTVSKNDIPKDIWNRYSKETKFSSFYLTPIVSKTKKKNKLL